MPHRALSAERRALRVLNSVLASHVLVCWCAGFAGPALPHQNACDPQPPAVPVTLLPTRHPRPPEADRLTLASSRRDVSHSPSQQSLGERTLEWTHAGTESCQRRDTIDKQAEAPTSMLPLAPPAISHDHVSLGAMSAGFQSGNVTLANQKKVASWLFLRFTLKASMALKNFAETKALASVADS